jgi:BspA type Leucine rich repeat region (6 copies)
LVNVTIPANIISIGNSAFQDCTSLSSVTFSNGITSIGDAAFWNCTRLSELIIPSSITNMGNAAFETCSGLTNVVISDGVTSIGSFAFFQCANLTRVMIPDSVITIGALPFSECTNLVAISVDAANPDYCSVGGVLFTKDQTTLMQYPAGKAGDYVIPNSITSIPDQVFDECARMTNIIIPSSVVDIGQTAFIDCINLKGIFFSGNAPSSIGMWAFYNVTNATAYYLPGTTGWDATFAGFPTTLWLPEMHSSDASFGIQTNQFGFKINWASGQTIVVEASTNLSNLGWHPVQTNTLTSGLSYFKDPQWTNYPSRFYRLHSQ